MSNYKELIIYAVKHLLDTELTEDSGWSAEEVQKLKEIELGEFEIDMKNKK